MECAFGICSFQMAPSQVVFHVQVGNHYAMIRRLELTIKTKLGLLVTTLINTVLFFALVTTGQANLALEASSPSQISSSGIVQDGLVYHVDITNPSSYTGAVSSITDLTNNTPYNGIYGTPTLENSNRFLAFDGTPSDYFFTRDLSSDLSNISGTRRNDDERDITFELWVHLKDSSGVILSEHGSGTLLSAWRTTFMEYDATSGILYADVWNLNAPGRLSTNIPNDSIVHLVLSVDTKGTTSTTDDVMSLFVNGELRDSGLKVRSIPNDINHAPGIFYALFGSSSTHMVTSSHLDASFSQFRVYDRALTDEEVFSNFVYSASQLFTAEIGAPASIEVLSTFNTIQVDWNAPVLATDTITGYQIEYKRVSDGQWTIAASFNDPSLRTFTITNLAEQEDYFVRVAAKSDYAVGLYGYPWEKLFETTNPRRKTDGAIEYTSDYGLDANDAYILFSGVDYSRVRYRMEFMSANNFVDADFNRDLNYSESYNNYINSLGASEFADRRLLNETFNLQVPTVSPEANQFIVKGDITDLTIQASGTINKLSGLLEGRLELWPYNYGTGNEPGFSTANASIYDSNDTPATGDYGSFQLHIIGDASSQTAFAWNRHYDANPDIGFGSRVESHPDWTFANNWQSGNHFYLGIFINPSIRTSLAGEAYQIQLNLAGGMVETNPINYSSIDEFPITLPTPTRSNYTFIGWFTSASYEGSVISQITDASNGSFTLYAKWITGTAPTIIGVSNRTLFRQSTEADLLSGLVVVGDENPTITVSGVIDYDTVEVYPVDLVVTDETGNSTAYPINVSIVLPSITYFSDGFNNTTELVESGTTLVAPTALSRADYDFVSWYYDPGFTNAVNFSTDVMPNENISLYAKWVRNYTNFASKPIYVDTTLLSSSGSAVVRVTLNELNYPGTFTESGSDIFFTSGANQLLEFKVINYSKINKLAVYDVLIPFVDVDNFSTKINLRYGISDDFSQGHEADNVGSSQTNGFLINAAGTNVSMSIPHEKIDQTLYNFPVTIRLTPLNFNFETNGSLLQNAHFTGLDVNSSLYSHEIELIDLTSKIAVFHVKIPVVSSSTNTPIVMHLGGSQNFGSGFQLTNVWASDYELVIHMGSQAFDSTGNHSVIYQNTNTTITPQGISQFFNGTNASIITGNPVPLNHQHTLLARFLPIGTIGRLNYTFYNVSSKYSGSYYAESQDDFDLLGVSVGTVFASGSVQILAPNATTSIANNSTRSTKGTVNALNWVEISDLRTALANPNLSVDKFATVFSGYFIPQETGKYEFNIEGDDAVDVILNGINIAREYGPHGTGNIGRNIGYADLIAGVPVSILIRQQEYLGGEGLRFFWRRPSQNTDVNKNWYQYGNELASLYVGANQQIISTLGTSGGYGISIDNQNKVEYSLRNASNQTLTGNIVLSNQYHVITAVQGNERLIFQDLTLTLSDNSSVDFDNSNNILTIGHLPATSNYFTGWIDSVRLSNINRSDAWIKAEAEAMEGSLISIVASLPPIVTTSTIDNVSETGADIISQLVSNGNVPINRFGIQYSSSSTFDTYTEITIPNDQANIGSYTISITGLQSNSTYYARAFAINNEGESLGSILTFSTLPTVPTIDLNNVIERSGNVVITHEIPTGTITSYEYSLNGDEWTSVTSDNGVITITGLINLLTYDLRLRALNNSTSSLSTPSISITPLILNPITQFNRQADQTVVVKLDTSNSGLSGFNRLEYQLDGGDWITYATSLVISPNSTGLAVRTLYNDDSISDEVSFSFNTLTYVVSGLSSMDVLLLPTDSNYSLVDPQSALGQVFIGWFTDNTWGTKITEVSHGSNVTVETYSADPLAIPTYTFTRTLQRDLLLTFNTVDSDNNPSQLLRLEYSVDNGVNWITYTQALNNAYWTSLGQTTIPVKVRPVYVGNTPSNSQLQFTLYPVNYRNNDDSIAFKEWVPQNVGSFRLNQAIPEVQNQVVILWYPTSARDTAAIEFTTMNTQAIDVYGRFEVGVYETSSGLINTLNPFAFANNVEQAGRIRISSSQLSSGDRLFIRNEGNVNDNGVISEASGIIFIGNGSSRTKIGAIDSFFNGENGRDLVINVDSLLFNGDFSQQLSGWIINEFPTANTKAGFFNFGQFNLSKSLYPSNGPYYNLNCTTTYNNSTQTWNYASNCNDARSYERGNWSTVINDNRLWFTSQVVTISNQNWVQLASNGWTRTRQSTHTSTNDFGTMFGPTISSVQTFSAAAGDSITFDWQAVSGGDAADVYGFVIDDSVIINGRPRLIPVFYRRVPQGQNQSGTHVHTFTSADLPQASSSLRFFFVNGTYDQTGGGLFGATFRITNITLNSALKLNATSANAILAQLAIEVLTSDPDPIYSFTFTSETENSLLQSGVKSIFVKGINTPPSHNDNIILQVNPGANVAVNINFLNDFTDPDSTLNFSATGLPSFLQLSSQGLLSLSGVAALTSDFSAIYSFDVTADDGEYSIAKTYTFIVNPLPEETFWSHRASAQYTIDPVWFQTIPGFGSITSAGITVGTLPACITRTNLTLQALGCNEGSYVIPVSVTNGQITYNFSATIHVSVDTTPPVISGVNSTTITTIDSSGLSLAEATITDNLDGATVARQFYPGFRHLVTPNSNRLIPFGSGIESVGVYDCNLTTMICYTYTPSQNPSIANFSTNNPANGFTMSATSGFTGLEFFIDQDPILGAIRFVSGNTNAAIDPTQYYLYGQLSLTEWTLIASGSTYLPEARLTAGSGVAINAITSYPAYRLVFDGPASDTWTIGDIEFYFIDTTQTLANEAAAIDALSNRIPVFVSYLATDEAGNTSSQTIRYNIVNFVPVVNQGEVIEVTEATAFMDYTLVYSESLFIDTDLNETLVYSITGLPPGLTFNPQTRTISGSPTLVSGLSVEPYTITLTATDTQGASVSRDHIIIVYYVADIIFDSNLGSPVDRQTRIISQPVLPFKPENPNRYAYDFLGWFNDSGLTTAYDWDGVMADETFTLYAKWIPVEYPITYQLNGGINGSNPPTYNIEQDVDFIDPSRVGYDFSGWYTEANFLNQTIDIEVGSSQALTIYAKWTPIVYTITYIDGGATDGFIATYTIESPDITLSRPSRTGLIFGGWSDNGFIPQNSIGNRTFTASWIPRNYTLTLLADGRQISRTSIPFGSSLANVSVGLPPARTGYDAIGWNQGLPDFMPADNITLTAVYAVRSYAFTALDDEGNELARSSVNFNAAVPYPANPTKEGFTFVRWSVSPASMPASDLTVSAVFAVAQYVVTFVDNEGNNLGTANVDFGAAVSAIEPPDKEGFVFVEWTGIPSSMPAAAVTVTAVYEAVEVEEEPLTDDSEEPGEEDDDSTELSAPAVPSLPNRRPTTPIIIPEVVLPPNPDPVITRVSVNGIDLDVSIIPGQPVGQLPHAVLDGYRFQGWMNAITGEMITPDTVINNPDFVVLVPLFEKAPSLIDAARSVFQALVASSFQAPVKTNDLTTRTDNIQSVRAGAAATSPAIELQGGLEAVFNPNGSVTIPLSNERIPITLRVQGLDALTTAVYYYIGEGAPEFDASSWRPYSGEPFLSAKQGDSVFMMVKDAYDTHQVSYLKPATFVENPERIPTNSAIFSADDNSSLTNTIRHSFLTKIEYEDTTVDLFVFEPTAEDDLEQVIVRYRANDHNKSLLLNVEALTWREEFVTLGNSLGVYLRSGDNLAFEVEYQFKNQASVVESFQLSFEGESIGVFLAVSPNSFLRAMLGVLVLSTLIAPYLLNPKPKQNMS